MKKYIKTTFKDFLNEQASSNNHIIGYHGTDNKFDVFEDDAPIFFVDNRDIAETYGDYVVKAELLMENPIIFDFENGSTFYFVDKWYLPSQLAKYIKEIADDMKKGYSLEDDIRDELGYLDFSDNYGDLDGIIMNNIKDANDGMFSTFDSATNYVVFEKSQIKIIK